MQRISINGNSGNDKVKEISIEVSAISHVDTSGDQTRIFISGKSGVLARESLAAFEDELLNLPFLKVNKSHIINLEHITHIAFGEQTVLTLSDNYQLTVDENVAMLMKKYLNK